MTCSDLVVLPAGKCPECGAPSRMHRHWQPALVRHGGYGAVQEYVVRWCRCGWSHEAMTVEVNPSVLDRERTKA